MIEQTNKYKRDEHSGALTNVDNDSLILYKLRKKTEMKTQTKIEIMERKIKEFDDKINKILMLLEKMENK